MTRRHDPHPTDLLILNAAFDAGGEIALPDLRRHVPASGIDLRLALHRQATRGNIRRMIPGDPVRLTASARDAIAAGRAA